jgi:predicted signal transduction protein with EAL and GGDEF domain
VVRVREILDFLRHDQRIIQVARVARIFKQDPVALLRDGGDEFETLVRIAASEVVMDDKKKEAEAERAAARR